ncbi:transcription antitermination factor NusB [Bacillus luteolus]|uniref:Transcription antitermination protein NusB n=1 Tax=Litchfieldia luteola TaxID=682179 RepID=A0ABR9QPN4_9BACI|nr:transcription antitermination factor NusB [Cytobacillus luteolus]MBE4910448.1 transcription antitermination factor NusB [Cytobacillus luteolus]MBP1941976.1 N utilization substance protein B [Cytobacillus luteolus]
MKRRTARERALQALFQIDLSDNDPREVITNVLMEGEESDPFLEQLVLGVVENKEEIDTILRANLEKWTLERVANVDRSLLRMAIFEMKYIEEIPVNVSMDEAIELAKTFGDDSSSRFINSILSKVKETL